MIATMAGYVTKDIPGGKLGYDRLALLARERWPDTRALLELAGISPGMRCVRPTAAYVRSGHLLLDLLIHSFLQYVPAADSAS